MPTGSPQTARTEYDNLKAKALEHAGRGDRVGTWQCWEELRARFPAERDGYMGAAEALRELGRLDEAEPLLQEAVERFPNFAPLAWERVRLAGARGDWAEAERRWLAYRAKYPEQPFVYLGGAAALRELGRLDEAERLLEEAAARYADHPQIAWEHARLASERRDWPEAARRWAAARKRFPERPVAYLSGAAALREMAKHGEAEQLLEAAAARFADHAQIAWEHVRVAAARRDWAEAQRRWQAYRARFPAEPFIYVTGATALRELGRLDEAERLLEEAAERFAEDAQIACDRAWLAVTRRDWAEAASRWQLVRRRFPDRVIAYIAGAAALREVGRLYEAERLLDEALGRFKDDVQIAWERTRLAAAQGEWAEAKRRWAAIVERWPDELQVHLGALAALDAINERDEDVLAAARAALARAKAAEIDNPLVSQLEFAVCRSAADWPEARRRWVELVARRPDELRVHLGAMHALHSAELQDEEVLAAARAALARAKASAIDNATVNQLELAVGRASADWLAVRQAIERIIRDLANPPARLLSELAMACWHLGDLDGAGRAAKRTLAAEPMNSLAAHVLVWIATTEGDEEKALESYRTMSRIAPDQPRWPFEIARLLYLSGNVDEAVRVYEQAQRRWPNAPILDVWALNHAFRQPGAGESVHAAHTGASRVERELKDVISSAPPDAELRRALAVDDLHQDVVIAEAVGADTVVLVFNGPHDHVTIPFPLFDRHLAAFGVTAIYVKDMQRLMYVHGVRSLGDYQQTLAALREMLDRLGATKLCTLGVEGGGYAAIRYGVELGVRHIVGFGIHSGKVQPGELGSEPFKNFLRARTQRVLPEERLDLKPFLESRRYSATIDLLYGEIERRSIDRAHAEHLSTLPGVRLRPQAGIRAAGVLRFMAGKPDFHAKLAELLRASTPSAEPQVDPGRRQWQKSAPSTAAATAPRLSDAAPSTP